MCSVDPTHRVSTVSGRTTTPTVAPVPAWSPVQYADRTSWRRSCSCSVSTAIGMYCSLELHTHAPDTETEVFMRLVLMKTSGEWIIHVFFHIMNYSITSLICSVICDEKCAYQCISVCLCRWVHAVCESLYTEDEVEQASDEGFACTSCTPYVPKPVGKSHRESILKVNVRKLWITQDSLAY